MFVMCAKQQKENHFSISFNRPKHFRVPRMCFRFVPDPEVCTVLKSQGSVHLDKVNTQKNNPNRIQISLSIQFSLIYCIVVAVTKHCLYSFTPDSALFFLASF